jgi:hypothetical protein
MAETVAPEEIVQEDFISVDVLNRMSLTLDYDLRFAPGAVVPKLWHWLFFLPQVEGCRENDQVFLWTVNPDGFETMTAQAKLWTDKRMREKAND